MSDDVTLAFEDGQQLEEAHKIVVVSLSQFSKNLLSLNKHQHPLIYLGKHMWLLWENIE